MAGAEIEEQVLAAPADAVQRAARQLPRQPRGQGVAQRRHARRDGIDAPASQARRQAEAGDFDFGQFWHGGGCLSPDETANIARVLYVTLAFPPVQSRPSP
jgi:hypothetical protein